MPAHTPLDSPTTAIPAVGPRYGGDDKWEAALGPADSSPGLTPDPGPLPAAPDWRRPVSVLAAQLHRVARCGCEYPGDVDGHGVDYEAEAEVLRTDVLADLLAAGEVAPAPRRYPVEAKVKAGAKGTLAASLVVALATLLLDHLDLIGSVFGGRYPWAGVVLAGLGAVLPAVIGTLEAYDAPHTPRDVQR